MKLLELLQTSTDYLAKKGVESPRLTMELILCHVLKKKRLELYLHFEEEIPETTLTQLRPLVKERGARVPFEYILGFKDFAGQRFKVTPDVLIPRPETELLFEAIIPFIKPEETTLPIVDVGTGSGILAVSLARRFPQLSVIAIDLSEKALEVAKENGAGLSNLQFQTGDLLSGWEGKAQLIVANLPYVPVNEIEKLSPEVKREPLLALAGGQDGLHLIGRLIAQAEGKTQYLALEMGDNQIESVKSLFKEHRFAVTETVRDFTNKERVIVGSREQA